MSIFVIHPAEFHAETGEVRFHYQLEDHRFTERLELGVGFALERAQSLDFAHLLDVAAAILGVSYYKLKAPTQIDLTALSLTAEDQKLIQDVYENGLGEFYTRNDLKRFGQIDFNFAPTLKPVHDLDWPEQSLVLIGGGKDSLVSVDLLTRAEIPFTPFAVNPKGPIVTSTDQIKQKPIFVRRYLSPNLFDLNNQPGFYNGHVPSTAINSAIAALITALYGYNEIILSNERSASEGNVEFDGRQVNHQHSKSFNFEQLIAESFAAASQNKLDYFSLLRPFSEVRIGQLFARTDKFDQHFSSCNENFKQNQDGPTRWCTNCPKCHFVSLILAPFMAPNRLQKIVGKNVLDDATKLNAFRELSGLTGHKPWECVGEILEAAAALWHLAHQDQWRDVAIVKTLKPELDAFYGAPTLESAWDQLLQDTNQHNVPEKYQLNEIARAS
ncbi:hypothetical protein [Maritalea mediterranea]|uniref:UDP-N-acetyl-alpha-D-muramoyl-L-alanyl-L-glutamate epimerase n=1 Tax=Maritalea mediterranea TaxID=2909667 RepID=A0ABS9E887_9HYPH|nr:hypothetical protein [Maritalea mediterranea]MCF4099086.1 hypothetical protein [Maritalea mediterranea]